MATTNPHLAHPGERRDPDHKARRHTICARAFAGVSGFLLVVVLAFPALAQERSPAQRQTLNALSYVLGQSHALRQACEGEGDQMWRSWMSRLLETESPDDAFERRMRDSFNTGYYAAQARFPHCDAASKAEAQTVTAKGKALTRQLGRGG